ncbi:unnamed protein product [Wuchereria bancrofti]|uniref:SUEL-type lectin domain-containing protein n=1 Tax=Wuchereria bancrofti TaxID=6293 RepID=A0A3P7DPF2_WUCBA|nr:unnamed protein product [Wuchereria bancrofti]
MNCDDKQRCLFVVETNRFGFDSCPGEPKYLEIVYSCIEEAQIRKRDFLVIYFDYSFIYFDYSSRCIYPWGKCSLRIYFKQIFYKQCNGHPRCSILVNNRELGDPCPNTEKYLDVEFKCSKMSDIGNQ